MQRPDILAAAGHRIGRVERAQIAWVRRTFEPGRLNRTLRWCQRAIGARWITACTRNLVELHGLERLPAFDLAQSFVCASNHRSFFDMYVITGWLVKRGLRHRIAFPVRDDFFYDSPLGLLVNGAMSFFAMYPPLFRGRLAAANLASVGELVWLLRQGGTFTGVHPEGTRKKDDDPYTFLPAQSGVGKLIHAARVPVIPAFINGLGNDLPRQIAGNFDGSGTRVIVVFGEPVDYGELLGRPASSRVYKAIAERTLEAIGELGREERRLRDRR
jgi:1-acyl-sn-glycerol-3-phosphate acyltransferase